MAFEKAYAAMERDDWNIVTEMLEKDELSSEDFLKKRLDDVRYLWSASYCVGYHTIEQS